MTEKSMEEELANTLLKHQPQKVEGGSRERQKWISLILVIQGALYELGYDGERYRRTFGND